MRVFFDIETIPTQDPHEIALIEREVREYNETLVKKKSEEDLLALIDEKYRATALIGAIGEVVCISAAVDNTPKCATFSRINLSATEEEHLLRDFASWLVSLPCGSSGIQLIGHNSVGFDRPFLRQRSLIRDIRMPDFLIAPVKPWEATHSDTQLMFSGDAQKRVSLDRLSRALGLGGKEGVPSAQVWDAIKAGDLIGVSARCDQDVLLTRQVWRRMAQTLGIYGL